MNAFEANEELERLRKEYKRWACTQSEKPNNGPSFQMRYQAWLNLSQFVDKWLPGRGW